jgi:hypothetical protein
LIAIAICSSCGKKGPPLPPLLRLPAAPAEINAERRGDDVIVEFNVPFANSDNTRPANVSEVEVFGFTGPASVNDEQLVKHGTRIGGVAVKKPRNPDDTIEPDESAADIDPLEGDGLDQGARARVEERLTGAALVPVDPTTPAERKRARGLKAEAEGPLLGLASPGITARTYVALGVSTRGKKGPPSRRVSVPLVPPPPPPVSVAVTYSETAVTVAWTPAGGAADILPSRPLDVPASTLAYHVYDVAPGSAAAGRPPDAPPSAPPTTETRLTKAPVADMTFSDARMAWGAERCYAVRAVESIDAFTVESERSPAMCVTLTDRFPPAAPKGLGGVASAGAISLIWEPSAEKDLAGYLVLRAAAPSAALEPLTSEPIPATTFEDKVQPGVRYVYAIVAVDKAGNRSPESNHFEETAR